jgi:SOS response regulatory protein OraA/RecX
MPGTTGLEQAAAALARRDRSAAALVAYLEERGVDGDEAAEAVERLRAAGYVDDRRLAALRAETLAGRGYGDSAIRADLEQHRVETDLIDEAVGELLAERLRAETLANRDGRTPQTARRLVAKGFATDTVAEVMGAEIS